MTDKVGDLIKKRRKELKLTQKDVYKKMGIEDTGLLSKYENNDVIPPFEMLLLLADALDKPISYFAGEISEKSSNDEKELLSIFRTLDIDMQKKALGIIKLLSA